MNHPQVRQLWRYPVKSLRGERHDTLTLEPRGVEGDRVFAVRAEDGKLGSGKSTRRFRRIDGLFDLGARLEGRLPTIRFPDGRDLAADDPSLPAALSAFLGLPTTVAREAAVRHHDVAPVHLLTTASLDWLRRDLPRSRIEAERFRANVLIEAPGTRRAELDWIGRTLRIGSAELAVTEAAERCRMVSLAQDGLPADPAVLEHIARHADARLGVYAEVVVPGHIRRGDPVEVVPASGT